MEIIMLTVGQVCTNCYIIHQEGTNSCVVIDPGDEAKKNSRPDSQKRLGL
ncbi:MAG: MBL fold metallo-hydrolase [Clostridium sp.]